jgi:predicted O-linked N-acetylglucosamine transferase (SPINDLY family)
MWRLRHLGLCPTIFRSFAEISDYRLGLERQLDEALANRPPFDWRTVLRDGFWPSFQLCHHGICNRGLKQKYGQLFAPAFPGERPNPKRRKKIRIGFTCTASHQGGFLRGFGGVMERLDRQCFEVVGLVSQSILPFCRSRVRADDTQWLGVPHNLERALELFTEAACDVVMHWHAGTDIVNYFLPFLPLAPVQCIGFGTHGTTGIANIDYFISSELFERGADADDDYTESLVQFSGPTSWQARPLKPEPAARSDFGVPETGTLYFCPQRHAKFHPDFDPILRRILEEDRSGHVIILQGKFPRTAELLRARLADALGETLAARVLFVPKQTPPDYYRLLSLADVVLDTPAYSASLTGYDAFSLGVPIVTLPGQYMVQRYARGLYSQMGISELVADSEDEYVDLAVRLGREDGFRENISQKIVERGAVLYECPSVVGEYERFFVQATKKASM